MSMPFTIYSKIGLPVVADLVAPIFMTGNAAVREQRPSSVNGIAALYSPGPFSDMVQVDRIDTTRNVARRPGSDALMLMQKSAGRTGSSVPRNAAHELSRRTSPLGKEVSTSLRQSKAA